MYAPADSPPAFDETCVRKARRENRWTAAEDKVLLAQVLTGDSLLHPQTSAIPLTCLKPTVARSTGDL